VEGKMTHQNNNQIIDQVNNSGYPLQLVIEQKVKELSDITDWNVMAKEHHWRDRRGSGEGFIDLILKKGYLRMVVECKREKDKDWVFLVPSATEEKRTRLKNILYSEDYESPLGFDQDHNRVWIYDSDCVDGHKRVYGIKEMVFGIGSYESEFCIKGNDKNRTILEQIASELIYSIDCLAQEEGEIITLNKLYSNNPKLFYIPLIVTTARLVVCKFNPSEISITDGMIPPTSIIEEVPLIRFKKNLGGILDLGINPISIEEANSENERSVLVVHAASIRNVGSTVFSWKTG
jgi:hypothetical protein